MREAKGTSCSTLCTDPARRASHAVLAPEPYSKTRAGRSRPASHCSTSSIAR